MSDAIVLLSGGLDSTVCIYWARSRYERVRAVSVDYGQRHKRELVAAKKIATLAGVELRTLKASIPWPPMAGDVLPGRNTILLGIASAHLTAWSGGEGGDVVIGCCGADAAVFHDCRPEFLLAAGKAAALGLGVPVNVVAPLVDRSKAQTILIAREVGAFDALAHSWTCYRGGDSPCGECSSCVARARGFAEAGEVDPWRS